MDEAILLPLAILALRRMIPPALFAEHRAAAEAALDRPASRAGALIVVALWAAGAGLLAWLALR